IIGKCQPVRDLKSEIHTRPYPVFKSRPNREAYTKITVLTIGISRVLTLRTYRTQIIPPSRVQRVRIIVKSPNAANQVRCKTTVRLPGGKTKKIEFRHNGTFKNITAE